MDCRAAVLLSFIVLLTFIASSSEGRTKKVVIHVPYKVKKIKHTHTIYKTIHHHHSHHEGPHLNHIHPLSSATEEHEHFHHMHIHDEKPSASHSLSIPDIGIGVPNYLPIDVPIDLPDLPIEVAPINRQNIRQLYRHL